MNDDQQKVNSCFHLLQRVLLEAFQTETLYFTPPYESLSDIDRGIRNIIWPNSMNKSDSIAPSKDAPERRFFVVRSNLGFYNLIIYLNLNSPPDFFSVGPFRSEEFSPDFFSKLIKDLELAPTMLASLQTYYEGLPYVSLIPIVNVTKQILSNFFPEFEELAPVYVEFEGEDNCFQINSQMLQDVSADFAEKYKEALLKFLDALTKGHVRNAQEYLHELLRTSRLLSMQSINECRNNLIMINGFCQLAFLSTNIHPSHVIKLYHSLKERIENCNSKDAISSIPNDICHKYCLLVKNYAFPEYSKTVRAVINYINLHLDEELTLALLAERFQKNATSLSSAFSKEVGINVTNYIHQTRINEAIRYFNTTKMSISEVALAVGFQDFAYFSRLFHKQVGCSPRDYCRSINK